MGIADRLEHNLQRTIGDVFARVFGGKVVFAEVEAALRKEASLKQIVENSRDIAPNRFHLIFSPGDYDTFTSDSTTARAFAKHLDNYVKTQGWETYGPVVVVLGRRDDLRTGQFRTSATIDADVASHYQPSETIGFATAAGASSALSAEREISREVNAPTMRPQRAVDHVPAARPAPEPDLNATIAPPSASVSSASDLRNRRIDHVRQRATAAPVSPSRGGHHVPEGKSVNQDYYDSPSHSDGSTTLVPQLFLADGSGRSYALISGENCIGRGAEAHFTLADSGVSRRHAAVYWNGRTAILSDLGSTNGTYVNDGPVQDWQLADGDTIQVGTSTLVFRDH